MMAITSIGILSPLGLDAAETAAALREGQSVAFPSDTHRRADGTPWVTAEVPPFDIKDYITPKPVLDRNSALLLAACAEALKAANCDPKTIPYGRMGIAGGTVWGGLDTLDLFFSDYLAKGPRLVKPLLFPHTYANTAVSLAAMEWALTGEHHNFVSDRTASGQAICEAAALVSEGRADLMLAVGAEALSAPLLRYLERAAGTPAPAADAPAEAGVALLLESHASATRRGVMPMARIHGCGCARTPEQALRAAMAGGSIAAADITWAALSRSDRDSAEHAALRALTGRCDLPVTSPLALCGELFGATTAFIAACAIMMRRHAFLAAAPLQPGGSGTKTPPEGVCAILTTSAANAVALLIDDSAG